MDGTEFQNVKMRSQNLRRFAEDFLEILSVFSQLSPFIGKNNDALFNLEIGGASFARNRVAADEDLSRQPARPHFIQ